MDKQLILQLKNQAFDKQREVLRSKQKRIALHVGRRGAKSSTIVLLYLIYALMHENIRLVYIGLYGEGAENAFYPHAMKFMKEVNLTEGIDYTYNKTERLFTFLSTNSTISLKGWDSSYKEMAKILGGNCFSVCLDEMQNQTQDTKKAIEQYIGPAVSDYLPIGGGSIFCLGTSGDYMGKNYWYQICSEPDHLGWQYFTWLDKENPHMLPAKLLEDEEFEKMYGPNFREEDFYKQQYLNQWVVSGKRLVYQFSNRNLLHHPECIIQHPDGRVEPEPAPTAQFLQSATYGLGMDWGFSPDPMAFLIVAYNLKYSNKLYVLKEYQQTKMYLADIDRFIREWDREYHFAWMVADAGALAKGQVDDLNTNFGWHIYEADKTGKLAHQNTLNSDFRMNNLLISPNCPQLIDQMSHLIWDPIKLNTENKRVEKEGLPNHLTDCLLYAHHHCRHLWYQPPKPKYVPSTPQEMNQEFMRDLMQRNKPKGVFGHLDFSKAGHRG